MTSEEREIFYFLKAWGSDYINGAEIARRAGGKRLFNQDPDWAKPHLMAMTDRGILEADVFGRYRIKPVPKKGHGAGRWVSPEIENILKEKGVTIDNNSTQVANDEYYEGL